MEIKLLLGSVTGVGLFMIGHLITAVWWAGKMSANADSMNKSIEKLSATLTRHDDRFYEKSAAKEQISRRDRELADVWAAVNSIRDEIKNCRIEHSAPKGG